jgi:hypothetical protein
MRTVADETARSGQTSICAQSRHPLQVLPTGNHGVGAIKPIIYKKNFWHGVVGRNLRAAIYAKVPSLLNEYQASPLGIRTQTSDDNRVATNL